MNLEEKEREEMSTIAVQRVYSIVFTQKIKTAGLNTEKKSYFLFTKRLRVIHRSEGKERSIGNICLEINGNDYGN